MCNVDTGTEELAHMEMVVAIIRQHTKGRWRFLRQREVVHFQRFGEGLRTYQEFML